MENAISTIRKMHFTGTTWVFIDFEKSVDPVVATPRTPVPAVVAAPQTPVLCNNKLCKDAVSK